MNVFCDRKILAGLLAFWKSRKSPGKFFNRKSPGKGRGNKYFRLKIKENQLKSENL